MSVKQRNMLQKLGADARGILTVTDPAGRQVLFTASSFAKADLEFAPLLPAIISKPDEHQSRPDRALSLYGKKAKDGYYVVALSGYNVNQSIALYKGDGDSIDAALAGKLQKLFPKKA